MEEILEIHVTTVALLCFRHNLTSLKFVTYISAPSTQAFVAEWHQTK